MASITLSLNINTGQALNQISGFKSSVNSILRSLNVSPTMIAGGVAGLGAGGLAVKAVALYAESVTNAIQSVRDVISGSIDTLAGQLPAAFGQVVDRVKEAMEAEGQRLNTANSIRIATGKNLAESGALGLQSRANLASAAAVLPGESKDYTTIFSGLIDNVFSANKAAGITNTPAIMKEAEGLATNLGVLQVTTKSTSTQMSDFVNRLLGAGDIKRLEKSPLGKAAPLFLKLVEDNILAMGSSLKDADLPTRRLALLKATKDFFNADYLTKAKLLLEASTGDFVSRLIDPEIGIFSFARVLNPKGIGKDFGNARTALDGVKVLMRTFVDLIPKAKDLPFDIMPKIRTSLMQLATWLKGFAGLDIGQIIGKVTTEIPRFITQAVQDFGPTLVAGVKAFVQGVADFIGTPQYAEMRDALMGLYNQLQEVLNGPAMRKIMSEVLVIQMETGFQDFGRNIRTFLSVAVEGFVRMLGDALKAFGSSLVEALKNMLSFGTDYKPSQSSVAPVFGAQSNRPIPSFQQKLASGGFYNDAKLAAMPKANVAASAAKANKSNDSYGATTINVHPSKGMDEKELARHTAKEFKKHQATQKRQSLG